MTDFFWKYKQDEPLFRHCTFKTGGRAKLMFFPETKDEILSCILYAKNSGLPFYILGKGSNVLFSDKGYDGIIIKICSNEDIKTEGSLVFAPAGISLFSLANACASASLGGLEFAGGIPGTVGGGIVMNAGAYGGEIKNVVKSVLLSDKSGNVFELSGDEMEFGYRKSIAAKNDYVVLSAVFSLEPKDSEKIKAEMAELNAKRREKQPLNFPSAGSTFKRPDGYFAGSIIEQAGLKGFSIGGAQVSEKHAGFVINKGSANSEDIYNLIRYIQKTVYDKFGVALETEVKLIGEF